MQRGEQAMGTKGRRNVKKPKKEESKKGEAFLILFSLFSLKGESGTNPRKGIAQSSVLFNLATFHKKT